MLCLSATGVRGADILFVTSEDDPLDTGDVPLVEFLEGFGHTVILIDDDDGRHRRRSHLPTGVDRGRDRSDRFAVILVSSL